MATRKMHGAEDMVAIREVGTKYLESLVLGGENRV